MSDKQAYNYRRIMSEPIEIQKLTDKVSLPMPVKVTSVVIFVVVDCLLYFFLESLILKLNSIIPGILMVIYVGFPLLFIKLFQSLKLDGLRLDQYLWSRINFNRKISIGNKVMYQDEFVSTVNDEPIVFSKVKKLEVKGEG